MIIKYRNKFLRKIFKRKYAIKIYMTFDNAAFIKDYLEEKIDKTAVGELKKGLENILK